jgi:hypothetical protein
MNARRDDQARQKPAMGRAHTLSRKKKSPPSEAISRTTSLMAYLEQQRAEEDKRAKLQNNVSGEKCTKGHKAITQPEDVSTNSKKDDGDRVEGSSVGHEKVPPRSTSRQQGSTDLPLQKNAASKTSTQSRRQTSNRDAANDIRPSAASLPSMVKKMPVPKENRQNTLLILFFSFIVSFVILQIIWVETMMNPTGSSNERGASLRDGGILHHGVHNVIGKHIFLRSKNADETGPPNYLPSPLMAQHESEIMKIVGNILPLQNILINAGHDNVTSEFLNQLPSPQEVESLYGSDAILYGSHTCGAFRSAVPELDRFISPAGMFNTVRF